MTALLASSFCFIPASMIWVQAQESANDRQPDRQDQAVVPPVTDNPGRRESAGIRGNCLPPNQSLTVIIPENQVTLTTSTYPSLFFYLPKTDAKEAIFILSDENDREIYKSIFRVADISGLLKVSIPDNFISPTLELDQNYFWQFALICDPKNPSKNPLVDGWVQRVSLNEATLNQLESASEIKKVNIYDEAGIWQDALTTLANLRQQDPDNLFLESQWNQLLEKIGLARIAQEPIVNP
jgi:hypothetical protein